MLFAEKEEWLVIAESEEYDEDWIVWSFDNIDEAEQHYNNVNNLYPQVILSKVVKQYAK